MVVVDVNVNKDFENGRGQLKSFKESIPEGLRSTVKKFVPIGSKTKRKSKAITEESYHTDLLFARVITQYW